MNTSLAPVAKRLERLQDRALMFAQAREFFRARHVIEVDCPLIAPSAIDAAIEPIPVTYAGGEQRHLITSPEFSMKRLLCEGMGDIYQMGHVFRDGELGSRHQPEFTMVEWYRLGIPFKGMIQETAQFCELFIGEQPLELLSYAELFETVVGLPITASEKELLGALAKIELAPYADWEKEGKGALIDMLFASSVEPTLGTQGLTAVVAFPHEKAELARTSDGVAERFELFFQGYELANGYGELADPVEHRRRFMDNNRKRIAQDKAALPLDEAFLQALERGLPDCCGVAVGFDRLMMLRHDVDEISEILSVSWAEFPGENAGDMRQSP